MVSDEVGVAGGMNGIEEGFVGVVSVVMGVVRVSSCVVREWSTFNENGGRHLWQRVT